MTETTSTSDDDLTPSRARVIAAIHALADWLAAHPDVRLPHSIDVLSSAGLTYNTSDHERLGVLQEFADAHGAETYNLPSVGGSLGISHRYAKVMMHNGDGCQIKYVMSTTVQTGALDS